MLAAGAHLTTGLAFGGASRDPGKTGHPKVPLHPKCPFRTCQVLTAAHLGCQRRVLLSPPVLGPLRGSGWHLPHPKDGRGCGEELPGGQPGLLAAHAAGGHLVLGLQCRCPFRRGKEIILSPKLRSLPSTEGFLIIKKRPGRISATLAHQCTAWVLWARAVPKPECLYLLSIFCGAASLKPWSRRTYRDPLGWRIFSQPGLGIQLTAEGTLSFLPAGMSRRPGPPASAPQTGPCPPQGEMLPAACSLETLCPERSKTGLRRLRSEFLLRFLSVFR